MIHPPQVKVDVETDPKLFDVNKTILLIFHVLLTLEPVGFQQQCEL